MARPERVMLTHGNGLRHDFLAPGPLRLTRLAYARDHAKMARDFVALAGRLEDDELPLSVDVRQALMRATRLVTAAVTSLERPRQQAKGDGHGGVARRVAEENPPRAAGHGAGLAGRPALPCAHQHP